MWPLVATIAVQVGYGFIKKHVKEQEMFDGVHIAFNWGVFGYFTLVVSQPYPSLLSQCLLQGFQRIPTRRTVLQLIQSEKERGYDLKQDNHRGRLYYAIPWMVSGFGIYAAKLGYPQPQWGLNVYMLVGFLQTRFGLTVSMRSTLIAFNLLSVSLPVSMLTRSLHLSSTCPPDHRPRKRLARHSTTDRS
jgi:hypothetical protein